MVPAEVGGEGQAGLRAKAVGAPGAHQLRHRVAHTRILPDQSIMYGAAGPPVPKDGGLALVGDSDARQVPGLEAALGHRLGDHLLGAGPDFLGIMLHPSRLRIDLPVLFLRGRGDPAGTVEQNEPRAGGALIQGADITGHKTKIPGRESLRPGIRISAMRGGVETPVTVTSD
jgi:hypothetical protein